ncbi:hypothetical protein [Puniceibacterium sp. IMCC21224]|uniref:hypothetical protein n=1 Tax=Puniceibacterium sp. IMCC21224 TaxID=1618204 RepID=UPI00065CEC7D|nr:hypothetical protein [Puniceibacterium sp. IMCC21224]KMK68707.1 hypothetical protein IMCC21224_113592 [Puniceibacterium sp. IMCC21224]
MDPIALVFYALVCGGLGWAGPRLGRAPVRFAIGVIVGIFAVTVLPLLRQMIG